MIKVTAKLKLYKGINKRKTPFTNGYRPLFAFIEKKLTSGQIKLTDKEEIFPGEQGVVEITFLNETFLGKNFGVGQRFTFYESKEALGEGEILSII